MPKIEKRDGGIPWLVEFHRENLRSKLGALSDHGSDRTRYLVDSRFLFGEGQQVSR